MNFVKKYGIVLKSVGITVFIVAIKLFVDQQGYAFIPLNALITALLGGVFFTLGILLNSAASDYKEAEKIPGDLAVSFKSFYADLELLHKEKRIQTEMRADIKDALYAVNENFRSNKWKLAKLDESFNKLNANIRALGDKGIAPNYLLKLRSELSALDKLSHRIDIITETTLMPAAYGLAELAVGLMLLLLVFVKLEYGVVIISIVSVLLISLLLLIEDMDNPFHHGGKTHVDVDLSILFGLEKYWKEN